jgi:hypothetical protein
MPALEALHTLGPEGLAIPALAAGHTLVRVGLDILGLEAKHTMGLGVMHILVPAGRATPVREDPATVALVGAHTPAQVAGEDVHPVVVS